MLGDGGSQLGPVSMPPDIRTWMLPREGEMPAQISTGRSRVLPDSRRPREGQLPAALVIVTISGDLMSGEVSFVIANALRRLSIPQFSPTYTVKSAVLRP